MAERLALIIANSQFEDPKLARLVAPNQDAVLLKHALENPNIGAFDVMLLIDAPYAATREAIARLYEGKKRSDVLLLYYSGHGIKDDAGDLYLATRETKTDLVSAASIDADFVRARLDKSNSQRKVIILDCCHSGAFMRGTKAAIGSSVDTAAALGGSGYGWGILTASNSIEYAWEDNSLPAEARTSIFTHFLVQGLETGAADLNQDGEVSLQELYEYVHEQVLTSGRAKQTPLMWHKAEGSIIIAQNPHPAVDTAVLPRELQQAINNSLPGVRAGAVTELERLLRSYDKKLARIARAVLERLIDDDSRRVSQAAAGALGRGAPPPAVVPDTPERHPSLGGDLRPSPASVDVGQETTWTFTLHNDGDTDLFGINARHGSALLIKPFDLKVGATEPITFVTKYSTPGKKTETVIASTATGDGAAVEHITNARVTVRQPKPEIHPSLRLVLSADPQDVDIGVEVRWNILVHNDGDVDLRHVVIHFGDQQKCQPFALLKGREKRFTFGRTYNTAGYKDERGIATGIASDGSTVRDEAQAIVTVRQPTKHAQAVPQEALREPFKAFAKAHDEEQTIQCPICNAHLKARNLLRHFDKVHAEDTSIDTASMRKKVETAISKAITGSESASEFLGQLFRPEPPKKQGTTPSKTPTDKSNRAYFEMLMEAQRPDAQLECPICRATLQAKNLLWHYDRRHTQIAGEPSSKPAPTGSPFTFLKSTRYEHNILIPIALKLLRVSAGEFVMGSDPTKDPDAQTNEQPQHRVNLPEFYISEYPITNAHYETFIKATGRDAPEHWKRFLLKPKIPSGTAIMAVTGVSWHDAVAFCEWLSKATHQQFHLPTEAEWEKAARGIARPVNVGQSQRTSFPRVDSLSLQAVTFHQPESPYGCMNMGNSLEWTQSLYWKYPYKTNDGRESLIATGKRTVRGQKLFTTLGKPRRYTERQGYNPATLTHAFGSIITFRVVMLPS